MEDPKKGIAKEALKGMQVKINYKNTEDFLIISMLKELEAVTLTGFESLLTLLLNQTCNQSQAAGLWFPSWCTTKEWYVRVQNQMQMNLRW